MGWKATPQMAQNISRIISNAILSHSERMKKEKLEAEEKALAEQAIARDMALKFGGGPADEETLQKLGIPPGVKLPTETVGRVETPGVTSNMFNIPEPFQTPQVINEGKEVLLGEAGRNLRAKKQEYETMTLPTIERGVGLATRKQKALDPGKKKMKKWEAENITKPGEIRRSDLGVETAKQKLKNTREITKKDREETKLNKQLSKVTKEQLDLNPKARALYKQATGIDWIIGELTNKERNQLEKEYTNAQQSVTALVQDENGDPIAEIPPQQRVAIKNLEIYINNLGKQLGKTPIKITSGKAPWTKRNTPTTITQQPGKVLTEQKTDEFLRRANGNKDLARQMARDEGYTF